MVKGIYSIFNEACKLCADNDEDEKYLMTFQNFLSRISKWNQDIINTETERIKSESGCSYLEDLLTCVHVTQLKMLTSVRVGQKQKKVDIDIPKLEEYVHKSYTEIARKVYKNAFLFEVNVTPLVKQKHMRELELIVRESLLNTIRDSMPIETILRAYIDETTEEDVYEVKEDTHEVIEEVAENAQDEDVIKAKEAELEKINKELNDAGSSESTTNTEQENTIVVSKSDELSTNNDATNNTETKTIGETTTSETTAPNESPVINISTETASAPVSVPITETTPSVTASTQNTIIEKKDSINTIKNEVSKELNKMSQGLTFNNNDSVKTYDTTNIPSNVANTTTESINAPKTIERLEEISDIRNTQRKLEEEEYDDDDDEKITIFNDTPVSLDILDVNNLSNKPIQLNDDPILGEITTLA
jgi:hypothetical protein